MSRIAAITALLLWVAPGIAHHSFSAEYSITAQVKLTGEITAVAWMNPHVFITVSVKDSTGVLQDWQVEGGAVNALKESGWTSEMLAQMVKSHALVTISGYRARNSGSTPVNGAWAKAIELPDGRQLPFN